MYLILIYFWLTKVNIPLAKVAPLAHRVSCASHARLPYLPSTEEREGVRGGRRGPARDESLVLLARP